VVDAVLAVDEPDPKEVTQEPRLSDRQRRGVNASTTTPSEFGCVPEALTFARKIRKSLDLARRAAKAPFFSFG
jgi:hypothetical protein